MLLVHAGRNWLAAAVLVIRLAVKGLPAAVLVWEIIDEGDSLGARSSGARDQ